MIDLHSHILYGIDDGSQHLDESIQMINFLSSLGFKEIFATPHQIEGGWNPARKTMDQKLDDIHAELDPKKAPQIHLGAEHHFDVQFMTRLKEDSLITMSHSSVILVELPENTTPSSSLRFLETIADLAEEHRYRALIAHPERFELPGNANTFKALKKKGLRLQLDLLSLATSTRSSTRRRAEDYLEHDLYDGLGSDLHNANPATLSALENSLQWLRENISSTQMDQLAHAATLGLSEPEVQDEITVH